MNIVSFSHNIVKPLLIMAFVLNVIQVKAQTSLPAAWLPGMKLVLYHGPGMQPGTSRATITEKGVSWEFTDGVRKNKHIKLRTAELDSLATLLRTCHFDKMETITRPDVVQDLQVSTLTLYYGEKIFGISMSPIHNVQKKYEKGLDIIYAYVNKLIDLRK